MNRRVRRAVLSCLVLVTFACGSVEALAQSDSSDSQATGAVSDQTSLLGKEKELHGQVIDAWRSGKGELVRQHLVQLLEVRGQMYPVASHRDGHANLLNCLLDLSRVCRDLNRTEDVVKYGRQAREMADKLYPKADYPYGHPQLAAAMMAVASGYALSGDSRKAKLSFLEAAQQMGTYRKSNPGVTSGSIEADAYKSLALICDREMKYRDAAIFYKQARQVFESCGARGVGYADCLLAGSRVLRFLGCYNESVELSQNALLTYRDLLVKTQPHGHSMIVRALREHGLGLFRFGSAAEARQCLLEALTMDGRLSARSGHASSQRHHILNGLLLVSISESRLVDAERYARELETSLETAYSAEQYPHGHPTLASFLTNLGAYYHVAGDLETGEHYYGRSNAMWRVLDGDDTHTGRVTVLDAMGRLYLDMGHYARAYHYQSLALSMAQEVFSEDQYPRGHEVLSRCLQNMAALYWFMGETEKSAADYREAVELNERLFPESKYPNRHPILQQSYAAWGCVLLNEGRLDEAEQFLRMAYETARGLYDTARYPRGHELLNQALFDLGTLESARGRFARARQYFEEVLENIRQLHDGQLPAAHHDVADTLAHLGRMQLAQGEVAAAIKDFADARKQRQALLPPDLCPYGHPRLFRSLIDLGTAYFQAGDSAQAVCCFSKAAEMEYNLVASFCESCSEAELLNYVGRKLQAVDYLLSALTASDARTEEVYKHVWRRHALIQRLVRQRQSLLRDSAAAHDPVAYEEYLATRRALSRALLVSMSDDAEGSHEGLQRLRRLNARKEQLERQLTSSAIGSAGKPDQTDEFEQLVDSLPHGTAFVDILKYKWNHDNAAPQAKRSRPSHRYMAFVLTTGRKVQRVELGEAMGIDQALRRWLEKLAESRVDGSGKELSERLWAPIARVLPAQINTVYLCPDAELATVPWAALPDCDQKPLVQKLATAVVPSGPVLLEQLRRSKSTPSGSSRRVLAIGDVDYGEVHHQLQGALAGMRRLDWDRLPGTAEELKHLGKIASDRDVVILRGKQATVPNVLSELPQSRWAHIATHGFFVDPSLSARLSLAAGHTYLPQLKVNATRESVLSRNPFVLSGLVLAQTNVPGQPELQDHGHSVPSLLTAETIATVDCSNLELVVLSACETARGDQQPGDGVFGLQCAFHVAGAQNVVASLWKVDDQAAQELMRAFYQHLWKEDLSPLEALRHAQLELMGISGKSAVPRGPRLSGTVTDHAGSGSSGYNATHWAGFVLSGCGL